MKRVLLIAVLLLFAVALSQAQAMIPMDKFSFGVKNNFVTKGSNYFGAPITLSGSAGAQSVSAKGMVFSLTGTAKQTSITTSAADAGRLLILIMASTDTLVDGSNLKLAGNFNGTADDVLVLIGDGTNWTEVCRAVN